MRPEVSQEVAQEVREIAEERSVVPAHRLDFEDQLRVVLDHYQELRSDRARDEIGEMLNTGQATESKTGRGPGPGPRR